jgi:hypothetical protein
MMLLLYIGTDNRRDLYAAAQQTRAPTCHKYVKYIIGAYGTTASDRPSGETLDPNNNILHRENV